MNYAEDAFELVHVEWSELQTVWQDSRAAWKDNVASQFQKQFMSPFETEIPVFFKRLESLSEELRRASADLH
jgi:hypothetical protein